MKVFENFFRRFLRKLLKWGINRFKVHIAVSMQLQRALHDPSREGSYIAKLSFKMFNLYTF